MACGVWNLVTPCVDFLLLPTPSVRSLTAAPGASGLTSTRIHLSSSRGGKGGALAVQMGGEQGHPAQAPGNPESLIPSLSGSQQERLSSTRLLQSRRPNSVYPLVPSLLSLWASS